MPLQMLNLRHEYFFIDLLVSRRNIISIVYSRTIYTYYISCISITIVINRDQIIRLKCLPQIKPYHILIDEK